MEVSKNWVFDGEFWPTGVFFVCLDLGEKCLGIVLQVLCPKPVFLNLESLARLDEVSLISSSNRCSCTVGLI